MTDEQFKLQVDRLKVAFGEKAFDTQRLFLIRQSLRSMSYDEFQRIVNRFMSTKKPNDPPLPKDFMESAMRRQEIKWQEREEEYQVRCLKCLDVGVLKIEIDGLGTLAICDFPDRDGLTCGQGAWQPWRLSRASESPTSKPQPLPWQEFKTPAFNGKLGQLKEKMFWWREKVRVAEEFWKSKQGGI